MAMDGGIYYSCSKGQLFTATSIAKLIRQLKYKPDFNREYIESYLLGGIFYRDSDRTKTIFKNIYQAPMGMHVQFDGIDDVTYTPIIDFKTQENELLKLTFSETIQQFHALLIKSVQNCIPATGQLGLELSGGLDSSVVSALARRCEPTAKILAFTNGMPFMRNLPLSPSSTYMSYLYDESKFSHIAAQSLNIEQIILNDNYHFHDIIETYTEILGTFSEVCFPIFNHCLYEQAKTHNVSVLLSGFGGDEMVSGHAMGRLKELKKHNHYIQFYYEVIRHKKAHDWLNLLRLMPKPTSRLIMPTEHFAYLHLDPSLRQQDVLDFPTVKSFEHALTKGALSSHFARRIETSQIITEHYQIAQHFPLINPELMHFFHQLPSALKRRHGKGRYLMRHTMKPHLPREIIWRKDKAGATNPAAWAHFTKQLPSLFLERISSDYNGILADYINIPQLIRQFETSTSEIYERSILNLSLFIMMFAHLETLHSKGLLHRALN